MLYWFYRNEDGGIEMKKIAYLLLAGLLLSGCGSGNSAGSKTKDTSSHAESTTTETSTTTTSSSQPAQSSSQQAAPASEPAKPMDVIYDRTFQTFMGNGQINIAFNPNGIYRCGYKFGSWENYYDGSYSVSDDGTIHLNQQSQHQLVMGSQENTYTKDTTDAPVNDYTFRVSNGRVFVTHQGEEVGMENLGTEPTYVYYDWVKKHYTNVSASGQQHHTAQYTNLPLSEMRNIIIDHTFMAKSNGFEFYAAFNPDGILRTGYKLPAEGDLPAREVFYDNAYEIHDNGFITYTSQDGRALMMTSFGSSRYTEDRITHPDHSSYFFRGDDFFIYNKNVGELKMTDLGTKPTYNYYDYVKKHYQKVDK